MEHPFEYRAHYNPEGKVCHCPWGITPGNEHFGSITKEASKLEWLEGRPGMEQPRNQYWLDYVKRHRLANENTDKLLPWLHREFKKGRLLPSVTDPENPYVERGVNADRGILQFRGDGEPWLPADSKWPARALPLEGEEGGPPTRAIDHFSNGYLEPGTLEGIQHNLEEMKKHGQGVDVMQHKVHELLPKVNEFRDWKAEQDEAKKREDMGEVLHKFDDGWTIRRLQNSEEHEDEGDKMGHCIGGSGYCDDTANGTNMYVSLRDHKNLPHASMQISPNHWKHSDTGDESFTQPGAPDEGWIPQVGERSRIGEFYGKEDSHPLPEYVDRMNDWLYPHNLHTDDAGRPQELDEYMVPGAEDVEGYNQSADGGYRDWAYEGDEEGAIGEHTDIYQDPHRWDSIMEDLLARRQHVSPGQSPERRVSPQQWPEFFDNVRKERHTNEFEDALHNAHPEYPVAASEVAKAWEEYKEPWYHPYTGEFEEGAWKHPIKEYMSPLFESVRPEQYRPQRIGPVYREDDQGQYIQDDEGRLIPTGEPYGPINNPYTYWHQSATTRPLYYRWVYSPSKGVTLGSNQDDHPALVKYHQGLGGDINDTDLVHGYASALDGGWRITDLEHKPVEDPYIVQQVVRRLNQENGSQIRSEGSWQPSEYDWDRLHYALPCETFGT